MAKVKTERQVNFTETEKICLARGLQKWDNVINGEFSATLTKEHKERAWRSIAFDVNAVGPTDRTLAAIKEKWKTMKKDTKKKLSHNKKEMQQTGSGEAKLFDLSPAEAIAQTLIGHASVHGVGGIDTLSGHISQSQFRPVPTVTKLPPAKDPPAATPSLHVIPPAALFPLPSRNPDSPPTAPVIPPAAPYNLYENSQPSTSTHHPIHAFIYKPNVSDSEEEILFEGNIPILETVAQAKRKRKMVTAVKSNKSKIQKQVADSSDLLNLRVEDLTEQMKKSNELNQMRLDLQIKEFASKETHRKCKLKLMEENNVIMQQILKSFQK